jgi:hypothetical protein
MTQDGTTNKHLLVSGLDFTTTINTLASGNKYMTISFVNNFETAVDGGAQLRHAAMAYVDPAKIRLYYRVSQSGTNSPNAHATALEEIITKAGLDTLSSTFTQANSDLYADCAFTIPLANSDRVESARFYCQQILKSTLGYLTFDSDGQANYGLLAAPAAGGTTISDDNTSGSTTKIDYGDLVSEIIPYNIHYPNTDTTSTASAKARYLHSGDAKLRFEHVLDDISSRIDDSLTFKSTPQTIYSFKGVGFELIEEILGGDLDATLEEIVGASTTKDIKIISLEISKQGINIEASELTGL